MNEGKIGSCRFAAENGVLTITTDLFSMQFQGADRVSAVSASGDGVTAPYIDITAEGEAGVRHYHVWEDLPVIYMPTYRE